jgi:hypothetical protein
MKAGWPGGWLPKEEYTMKIFRHLGLMIAVFWCAAMVMAPMAAAAGAGQVMNQGNNQMQPGQGNGPGGAVNQQGNNQNNAGPGQGSGPQEFGRRNMTGFGNQTMFGPDDGNMTAPPDMPDWADNSTAMNRTSGHGFHGNMTGRNVTGINMTDMPPPGEWNPANMTAMNQTGRGHGNGNMTPPAPQQQNGTTQNQSHGQNQQANQGNNQNQQNNSQVQNNQNQQQSTGQNNSNDSLIAELVAWLKAHGVT